MKQGRVYQTRHRERIWAYILSRTLSPFYAQDMHRHFLLEASPIGMSTIYRQLDHLIDQKLLVRFWTAKSDSAFYCYLGTKPGDGCPTLCRCAVCGRMFPLKAASIQAFVDFVREKYHFHIELERSLISVICHHCNAYAEKDHI